MNNLNSVLMEGQLTMNAILRNEEKTAKCIFSVKSTRKEEISIYNIEVYGKLAEVCGTLTKGRDVRIVGRLKQTSIGVVIIAEHVEFKPAVKRRKSC